MLIPVKCLFYRIFFWFLFWLTHLIDLTTHAISDADLSQLKTQNDLASAWRSLNPSFSEDHIHVLPSIEHAYNVVRRLENDHNVDVLVTGSLHLVGGMIEVARLSEVAL